MQPLLYLAQTFNGTYTTTTSSANDGAALGVVMAFLGIMMLPILIMSVITIAGMWKVYAKAKQPGWAAIVPIYNLYVLQLIVGRPAWWTVLYFVPVVGFVIGIINSLDLVKSFGKDAAYALLLIFVPVVGYPLLGFGSAQYNGPSVGGASMAGPAGVPPNPVQSSAPIPPPPPVISAQPTPQPPTQDDLSQPPTPPQAPPVQ